MAESSDAWSWRPPHAEHRSSNFLKEYRQCPPFVRLLSKLPRQRVGRVLVAPGSSHSLDKLSCLSTCFVKEYDTTKEMWRNAQWDVDFGPQDHIVTFGRTKRTVVLHLLHVVLSDPVEVTRLGHEDFHPRHDAFSGCHFETLHAQPRDTANGVRSRSPPYRWSNQRDGCLA